MWAEFRRRFWLPPRAHGDVIEDRTVSFLELFYDLVYVVVISRASHALATDVSWRSVWEFAVIFTMIWIAWLNGTLYYDLHGREEGRTRLFVFVQMLLLALLAVFTADANGTSGTAFAIVYALYMAVLGWLWYSVRRVDAPEFGAATARYLVGMVASVFVVGVSAALPPDARMIVWAVFAGAWIVGGFIFDRYVSVGGARVGISSSAVERFDLFIIIVLGEVVVGVVTGLSVSPHDATAIATGIVGLTIGFGLWWTYFDFVGRRRPRDAPGYRSVWMFSHLPIAMAITASGAAMVSLIADAGVDRTPEPTSRLLGGSVAIAVLSLIAIISALMDRRRLAAIFSPLIGVLAGAAALAMLTGWLRPPPLALVSILALLLLGVWLFAVDRWLSLPDPDAIAPGA
jgi:low temperature requirement protein LtrA